MTTTQLSLFEQAPGALPKVEWPRLIWTPEYNRALNDALLNACRGNWKTETELAPVQAEFGLGERPFGCAVMYLVRTGKLRIDTSALPDGTFLNMWRTA